MPLLEGFWIKNYRVLKQVAIGSCYLQFVFVDEESAGLNYELSPATTLIGRTGSGKSTVLDAFAFISDCLKVGVDDACIKRGGYEGMYSRDSTGPISFGFNFRLSPSAKVLTYVLNIDFGSGMRPFVDTELLAYRSEGEEPFDMPILFFQNGKKIVRHFMSTGKFSQDMTRVEQTGMRHLGLAVLGQLAEYPVVGAVKNFFENYYCTKAKTENRDMFLTGSQLNTGPPQIAGRGEGLMALLRHYHTSYPSHFEKILDRIAMRIPDVEAIEVVRERGSRFSLAVKHRMFAKPFPAEQVPEGLLRLIHHFLVLEEPSPAPLIGLHDVEEGLDRRLMKVLAKEIHDSAKTLGNSQLLITTHAAGWADWMHPESVWILERMGDGFTQVQRSSDFPGMREMLRNNQPYGEMWYSDYFDQSWREIL